MNKFVKFIPCNILKPYIKHFVVSESKQEQLYKVLPDTSLVMGFQYKGELSHIVNNAETKLALVGITGIQDGFRIFRNTQNIGTVLVYFNEFGASHFFSNPLHKLFSQSVSLEYFIPASVLNNIGEELAEAQNDQQRIRVIEEFLISQLIPTKVDLIVTAAIQKIYESKGTIRMKELADKLMISQSPLEKRFRKMVGATPKKFASIVRLKAVIHEDAGAKNMTELGYENGYYDQAHFIKDFKLFTGETPEKYFLKR